MYEKISSFKTRIEQRIEEIRPYVITKRMGIEGWKVTRNDSLYPPVDNWEHVKVGYRWENEDEIPVWFETTVHLPRIEPHQDCLLSIWTGGESLVFIDGKPFGEINPYHRSINVNKFCTDKNHTLSIQTVPHLLFGEKSTNRQLEYAFVLIADRDIKRFTDTLQLTLDSAVATDDTQLQEQLCVLLEETLIMTRMPRSTARYTASIRDNKSIDEYITKKYISENIPFSGGNRLDEDEKLMLWEAWEYITTEMKKLLEDYPKRGEISAMGHAHIDYAWLWPVAETKRKIPRTFANALSMMERYPDFVFTQSSAQMYADIKELYPDIFKRIKEQVKNGNWEVTGGSWVENDCNVPSPESLARQFYYGQTFFKKEFGTYNKVSWLPDVFGFPWVLPQICKEAGIDYFFTTKLTWNDKNPMPHDIMRWRGLDGSEVIYRSFKNPMGYNADIDPKTIYENWENYKDKTNIPLSMMTYGYGDGGGGPVDQQLDNLDILDDIPGVPDVTLEKAEEHFDWISQHKDSLPVWDDELYLEFHRGTYTTQARTKKLHKECEDALAETEMLYTLLENEENYPHDKFDNAWKTVLRNEFHDILPGSSIPEVYMDSERELGETLEAVRGMKDEILKNKAADSKNYVSVFNPSEHERPCVFELETENGEGWVLQPEFGEKLIPMLTHDGKASYNCHEIMAPFATLRFFKEKRVKLVADEVSKNFEFENFHYRAQVMDDGSIQVYNKETEKYLFREAGNILRLYEDVPMFWDAWDTAVNYEHYTLDFDSVEVDVIESTPAGKVIEVTYTIEESTVVQRYIFKEEEARIDIENDIDWHHRRVMLKADFETTLLSRKATFDLGAGFIERATHKNTDRELARFEMPGHRWIDLSERDFGVSLLNNGKYGYSVEDNCLSLTLLRSPINPSVFADEGRHSFTYSIFAHYSSDLEETVKEARNLNRPLTVFDGVVHNLGKEIGDLDESSLHIMCLKTAATGGTVLRVCETLGSRDSATLSFKGLSFEKVYLSNILEEELTEIPVAEDKSFSVEYEPFKIYTFILK
jgi:alpha-mannosidase